MKRRQFLAGGVAGSTLAASGMAVASSRVPMATLEAASRASVVLQDQRVPIDAAVARRLAANGAQVVSLTDDPVRLWRSEVGAVLRLPGTRLFGVTRWADYLIVRGLAVESRRHVRHERHDPESGTFTWFIA